MISTAAFRKLALSFDGAVELPHFENASFRVKKKIFATLNKSESRGCLKLSEEEQALYCSHDKEIIYPVPNKWGKQGWTLVNLKKISPALLKAALKSAYVNVAAGPTKSKNSRKTVKSL
jgi:predicted DNA-binding protein (MmcQ/YjbR family)